MTRRAKNTSDDVIRANLLRQLENAGDEEAVLKQLERIRKINLKISDKGGIVVVADDDTVVTTYQFDSYRRSSH